MVLPPRHGARGAVAERRRRDRAPVRPRRRPAGGRNAAAGRACAGDGGAAGARTRSPPATCWNSMPSCGRPASACRRRAGWPPRWTSPGDDELTLLPRIGDALIDALEDMAALASPEMKATATAMARGNWAWGSEVLAALGLDQTRNDQTGSKPRPNFRPGAGLDVWKSLPAWEEPPPPTPPGSQPVEPREARLRLAQMVSAGPNIAEARPTQSDYASAASEAFAPREAQDKPQGRAGRSRDRRRQDAGLCRPGEPVGREERRAGLDRDLHPQPAAPDRQRARPAAPRFGREAPPRGDPQGPRKLSLPAELPGGGDAHRPGARERRRPRPAGALGAGQPRRRHDRRRPARLAARPAGPGPHHPPRRPPRRMHLLGLRALQEVLRRAHHPPRPPGRHRDRQPCAGDGAGGDGRARRRDAPAALRVRRGTSPVRCGRRRVCCALERR